MKKIKLIILAAVGLSFVVGCGEKYPMPPIPEDTGMPPESTYVSVGVFDLGSGEVRDVFVGKSGLVFVVKSDSIIQLYLNGARTDRVLSDLGDIVSADQAIDRTLFILNTSEGSILRMDEDGGLVSSFSDSGLTSATDLTVSNDYQIFVSIRDSNLIVSFDTLGNVIDTIAVYGNGILDADSPVGLAVDPLRGILFFASSGHNWVEGVTISRPRTNMLHLGGIYPDGGSDDTLFDNPLDVAVDFYGNIFVADSGNHCIKKFSPNGNFITSAFSRDSTASPVRLAVSLDGESVFAIFVKDGGSCWLEKLKKSEAPTQGGGGE
ncbi:MAG: hypothetical protein DRQ10_06615 [Candidatus Hydrothermota bacterium]|nr:MAG: hypothetical protein DRQ10_06615 [Candidatus Hydrothermae bacterium]